MRNRPANTSDDTATSVAGWKASITPIQRRKTVKPRKTIALIGLMGAGKSCIGKLLAKAYDLPFVDADQEIEKAAGTTIGKIFEAHGESAFRDGERRVIQRLLKSPTQILSTGGGAFIDAESRKSLLQQSHVLWVRAELDLLVARTARRNHRPLLHNGNHREILGRLIEERHPIYQEAQIIVDSIDGPAEQTCDAALEAIDAFERELLLKES